MEANPKFVTKRALLAETQVKSNISLSNHTSPFVMHYNPIIIKEFRLPHIHEKKFVLQELPNSSETEDMRKIRYILPNFTVK